MECHSGEPDWKEAKYSGAEEGVVGSLESERPDRAVHRRVGVVIVKAVEEGKRKSRLCEEASYRMCLESSQVRVGTADVSHVLGIELETNDQNEAAEDDRRHKD